VCFFFKIHGVAEVTQIETGCFGHGELMKRPKGPELDWILGKVNWYDSESGKGSIVGDDGVWYRIHEFSEIQAGTKGLTDKARVKFALVKDSVHPIVRAVKAEPKINQDKSSSAPGRQRSKMRDL